MRTRVGFALLLTGILVSPVLALDPRDMVGLYLTWHEDPTTSIGVNWVDLYEDSGNTVMYRAADETAWKSATGSHGTLADTVMRVHQVALTGLKPDTLYFFVVDDKEPADPRQFLKFRTMPARMSRPIRFVTGGDMQHSREMVDAMNRIAASLQPDFAVLGGDLAYANDIMAVPWFDWLQSWTKNMRTRDGRLIPMIAIIGNHEVSGGGYGQTADQARYYYDLFPLPDGKSNFAVDFGNYLSFIAMDSDHSQRIHEQTAWLEDQLKRRKKQKFLFPVYHYPAYGTAKLDKESQLPCDNRVAREIRNQWVPLFEQYGVTATFENDHHTYKRTHRLLGHQRDDENGILYLGDGAWGVKARPITPPVEQIWYLARAEQRNHIWLVTLEESAATFEAMDMDGEVFDKVATQTLRSRPVAPQPAAR
jgi:acid phosphatase type 7